MLRQFVIMANKSAQSFENDQMFHFYFYSFHSIHSFFILFQIFSLLAVLRSLHFVKSYHLSTILCSLRLLWQEICIVEWVNDVHYKNKTNTKQNQQTKKENRILIISYSMVAVALIDLWWTLKQLQSKQQYASIWVINDFIS